MSDSSATSPAPDGDGELRRRQQAELSRFFVRFAMIEAAVLTAAVVIIFVLELIDPSLGIWVLIALAAIGATVLSGYLVTTTRRHQRERGELRRG